MWWSLLQTTWRPSSLPHWLRLLGLGFGLGLAHHYWGDIAINWTLMELGVVGFKGHWMQFTQQFVTQHVSFWQHVMGNFLLTHSLFHQLSQQPHQQCINASTSTSTSMTTTTAGSTTTNSNGSSNNNNNNWGLRHTCVSSPGMLFFHHYCANLHTGTYKPQHWWLAASTHAETQEGCLLSLSGGLSFFNFFHSTNEYFQTDYAYRREWELQWCEGLMRYCNDRNNCHHQVGIKTAMVTKVAMQGTNEVTTNRARRCHLLVPLVIFFLFQF